jgi:hypothetical protein
VEVNFPRGNEPPAAPGGWRLTILRSTQDCPGRYFIVKKVFYKSFLKSQLPHKSVNVFIILAIAEKRLTDLFES